MVLRTFEQRNRINVLGLITLIHFSREGVKTEISDLKLANRPVQNLKTRLIREGFISETGFTESGRDILKACEQNVIFEEKKARVRRPPPADLKDEVAILTSAATRVLRALKLAKSGRSKSRFFQRRVIRLLLAHTSRLINLYYMSGS